MTAFAMAADAPLAWSLRNLEAGDAALAARLHASCFAASRERPWNADEVAALLAMRGTFGLLLSADTDEGGLILVRALAGEAEILTLGVVPQCRHGGGGRLLLQRALEEARARGTSKIFLEVAEDNVAAIGLYISAGFTRVGRREGYYSFAGSAPMAAIVMRLCLR